MWRISSFFELPIARQTVSSSQLRIVAFYINSLCLGNNPGLDTLPFLLVKQTYATYFTSTYESLTYGYVRGPLYILSGFRLHHARRVWILLGTYSAGNSRGQRERNFCKAESPPKSCHSSVQFSSTVMFQHIPHI